MNQLHTRSYSAAADPSLRDKDSAEKYKDDLKDISKKMKEIAEKAEAVEIGEEQRSALEQKTKAKLEPLIEAYTKQFGRLMSDPEIMKILGPAMGRE